MSTDSKQTTPAPLPQFVEVDTIVTSHPDPVRKLKIVIARNQNKDAVQHIPHNMTRHYLLLPKLDAYSTDCIVSNTHHGHFCAAFNEDCTEYQLQTLDPELPTISATYMPICVTRQCEIYHVHRADDHFSSCKYDRSYTSRERALLKGLLAAPLLPITTGLLCRTMVKPGANHVGPDAFDPHAINAYAGQDTLYCPRPERLYTFNRSTGKITWFTFVDEPAAVTATTTVTRRLIKCAEADCIHTSFNPAILHDILAWHGYFPSSNLADAKFVFLCQEDVRFGISDDQHEQIIITDIHGQVERVEPYSGCVNFIPGGSPQDYMLGPSCLAENFLLIVNEDDHGALFLVYDITRPTRGPIAKISPKIDQTSSIYLALENILYSQASRRIFLCYTTEQHKFKDTVLSFSLDDLKALL